jgi:hypothetical protein
MKRVLNFTDRKKIERKNVSLQFKKENNKVTGFVIKNIDLNGLGLRGDALVYVEAYYRTELKRFKLGIVDSLNPRNPPNSPNSSNSHTFSFERGLKEMTYPENSKFRILVVDPSDLKILAHADKISPDEMVGKNAILPVQFTDLGNEIWRVEYEGDEGAPILLVNEKIPSNFARQDPQFLLFVYPAVLREILTHIVFVDKIDSTTEPTVDWHCNWLKFIQELGVKIPESLSVDDDNENRDDILEWIDKCVEGFCNKYSKKFQEYVKTFLGEI